MARPDGANSAQLFYNRRMKQLLPILPVCTNPRERAKFIPGDRVTVQDPASKKWSTTAIIVEEREHGNSYVLTTEGTDKTFI